MSLEEQIDGALVRAAAEIAGRVRDALAAAVDVDAVVDAWFATHPGPVSSDAARTWAQHNIDFKLGPLEAAMRQVYALGFVFGRDAAAARYRRAIIGKAAGPEVNQIVDWGNWSPGNNPAEALLRPTGGLDRLLNRNRPTVIRGVGKTQRDRIGTMIADTMRAGSGDVALARELLAAGIKGLGADANRALMIATTEMSRAMNVAAIERYQQWGVEQVEWLGADPCDTCEENVDGGPVDIGDVFPSGDSEPPAHTNCRCSLGPVVAGNVDLPDEESPVEGDAGAMEISADSSHDISDVMSPEMQDAIAAFAPAIYRDLPLPDTVETKVKEAWKQYQGHNYQRMNNYLRIGMTQENDTKVLIDNLSKSIAATPMPVSVQGVRYTSLQEIPQLEALMPEFGKLAGLSGFSSIDAATVGRHLDEIPAEKIQPFLDGLVKTGYVQPGFSSVSALHFESEAEAPFKLYFSDNAVQLNVSLPAGAQATRMPDSPISEREIVVQKNSEYAITRAVFENGKIVLDVLLTGHR